mmetsp:Transcript_3390/g.10444  ORF Transcript_3390/g.10444 Transcript_3390/m.10444 type:complete len:307 (-) Transcript_3390:272-1192(-)
MVADETAPSHVSARSRNARNTASRASNACSVAALKLTDEANQSGVSSADCSMSCNSGPCSHSGTRLCAKPLRRSCTRSRWARLIVPTTLSIVSALRLMLSFASAMSTLPSTRVRISSRPVNGGKRHSRSCGYCEIHSRLQPRSTAPIWISKRMDGFTSSDAYSIAILRSYESERKPRSTPPRTPCALGVHSSSGSTLPLTPRYTGAIFVSLLALMMAELITWIVVTYRLPLHPSRTSPKLRSTALYLTNIGPVYKRAPKASSRMSSGSSNLVSIAFRLLSAATNSAWDIGLRRLEWQSMPRLSSGQ